MSPVNPFLFDCSLIAINYPLQYFNTFNHSFLNIREILDLIPF